MEAVNDWLRVNRVFRRALVALGLINVVMTVGSLLAPYHWALDVLTHFTLTYTFVLALCVVLALALRLRLVWTGIFVLGLLPNLVILFPYFVGYGEQVSAGPGDATLTVLNMNISTASDHYEQVTDLMASTEADVVALVEVRQDLLDHIAETLGETYPYVYAKPSRHTMGLAVVSRYPFSRTETAELYRRGTRSKEYLDVTVDVDGQPVRFFTVHPFPPMGASWVASRDGEFTVFAEHAQDVAEPLVLVGDFNATPWSAPVRELTASTDLRPANLGFGVRPTWFFALVMQAPLDYLLVSDELAVTRYQTGKQFGSDHLPVVAELRLAN